MRLRPLCCCALGLYTLVASGLPLAWHLVLAHGGSGGHETATCVSGCEGPRGTRHSHESTVPAHDGHRCEICYQIAVVKTAVDLPVDDGWAVVDVTCDAPISVESRLYYGGCVTIADPRAPPC